MAKKKGTKGGVRQASRKSTRVATRKTSTNVSDGGRTSNGLAPSALNALGLSNSNDVSTVRERSTITAARCYLLEMTAEIRQKIWNYAVKHENPISPKQVKDRSNKFWPYQKDMPTWASSDVEFQSKEKQFPETLITAAQLSRTCHQIYDEVAGTGLFYQVNEFHFFSFDDMLPYLVAITPIRRNAIHSVIMKWRHDRWTMKHALTMLATCEGLRKLEVTIHSCPRWYYHLDYWKTCGFHECLTTDIRGLESFKLTATIPKPESSALLLLQSPNFAAEREAELADMRQRASEIEAKVTEPRVVAVALKKIRAAEEASRLNIFGEGRLGPDKKPGIIASRTRGQLQKQKTLNEFGLIQEADEHPKFSKFGDLLWDVLLITDSRELASDRGKKRIEVKVTWATRPGQSWEILDRIINSANVLQVARLYVKKPEAYDMAIASSTIKEFVEKDIFQTVAIESLATMMKRNDSPEAGAKARRLGRSRMFR